MAESSNPTASQGPTVSATKALEIDQPYGIPVFYCNGYGIRAHPADLDIVLHHGPEAQAAVSLPWPVAKALMEHLQTVLKDYESRIGTKILTLQELDVLFKEGGS